MKAGVALAMVVGVLLVGGVALRLVREPKEHDTVSTERSADAPAAGTPTRAAAEEEAVASPTVSGVSVDPDEASAVARQVWEGVVAARHNHDPAALRALQTGPALEATVGDMCECPSSPPLFVAESFTVNVPRQSSWPAVFFASVTYTSSCEASAQPCVDSFVAVQDQNGGPWKMALWVGYSGQIKAEFTGVEAWNFAFDPPALTDRDAINLPAEYAQYRDALKRTGQPPPGTRFGPGPFTTGEAETLYDPPAKQQQRNASSVTTYRAGNDPVYAFTAIDQTSIICGTIRYTSVETALPGLTIQQSADQTEYGTKLAPGQYSSVVEEGVRMNCYELYADPSTPVVVFGSYGSSTTMTGTPAG